MARQGDIADVKLVMQRMLQSDRFAARMAAVLAEKGLSDAGLAPVDAEAVYAYERATRSAFPMCELLAHRSGYGEPDRTAIAPRHEIGIRWTVVEATEELATLAAEALARATVDLFWEDGTTQGLWTGGEFPVGPVSVLEEDYSPLVPSQAGDSPFMKGVVVVVAVEAWRDRDPDPDVPGEAAE